MAAIAAGVAYSMDPVFSLKYGKHSSSAKTDSCDDCDGIGVASKAAAGSELFGLSCSGVKTSS